ncbi:MAG: general secretion pathway protein GspB [Candidatus Thiodiazotropha sp. 6PLUC2]
MSSILDALERASQDRSSSDLELMPKREYADSPRDGRVWQWLLFGLAIVCLCLIGVWLYSTQISTNKGDAQSVNESVQQPEVKRTSGAESVVEASVVPVKPDKPDLESQLIGTTLPSQRSLLDEAILSQPKQQKQKVKTAPAGVVAQNIPVTPAAPPVVRAVPLDKPKPQPKVVSRVAKNSTPDPVVSANRMVTPMKRESYSSTPSTPPEPEVKVVENIPLIWEMPQSLRQKLEQLKISIHVYHKEPKRRFVLINMRRYAEGDSLKMDGFRLQRIDREGIVVDYGEGLVRLLRERY